MVVYKTTNLITGKIYIGANFTNNSNYLGSGKLLKLAILEFGRKNFSKEILECCKTLEELNIREKYWIKFYNSQNREIGYNISSGGGNLPHSLNPNFQIIREKISKSRKGHTCSFETRQKISRKNKGKKHKFRKFSEEHKLAISIGKTGVKLSEEHKLAISNAQKGKKHSKEWCKNISLGQKGQYRPPASDETKLKMSITRKGKSRKPFSEEWKENIRKARIGTKASEETKLKMSLAAKGKKMSPESLAKRRATIERNKLEKT